MDEPADGTSEPATTVGLLHPGAMGAEIGAILPGPVLWAGDGRSAVTGARAERAGLVDVGRLEAVVAGADIILSVCPPAAALDVADQVHDLGFDGIYVDANAISPATARAVASRFARPVDGGIVGPPPTATGTTRLYLSGADAPQVARLVAGSRLEAVVLDGPAGSASALKMAYAGWTKGSSALLLAVRALAEAEGVSDALADEWDRSQPGLVDRVERTAGGTGPKAWRFVGEMEEISDTLAARGLPDQFHRGAAEVYRRLAPLRGSESPTVEEVLDLLLTTDRTTDPTGQ
jgi:3-hydroxyisobutyrate dehydrogenase-like beta-hydroxyacid dehydrogenase